VSALIGVALLVAIAVGVEAWRRTHAAPAVHYTTVSITQGPVTRIVTATGAVNPVITVQVGTYVSGVIEELSCDYNTRVRKGQLCAKIDPRPYQTVVAQDRANLSTSRAQLAKDETSLAYAKVTYERTSALRDAGIVSQDTLDSARTAFDQATAQVELSKSTVEQHQAALDAAEINLAYTDIVSPVDGTVVSRNVTRGQTVAASFQTPTLFLIAADLTKMQVDANVSETDIGGIAAGNAATFTVEAFPNRTFQGIVEQVRQAPQTVQNVVTYDVVISVANRDLLLKPGMTATVRVVVARHADVMRVPDQALRYTPGGFAGASTAAKASGPKVWILRDGKPASIAVEPGLDDDVNTEIRSPALKPGDEVIVSEQAGGEAASARLPFLRL
jgi:HlyD family secretion protein